MLTTHQEPPMSDLVITYYEFEELGISPLQIPDCKSVFVVQDVYTRQFYTVPHKKFLEVAQQKFSDEVEGASYSRNHGIVDTFTAVVALIHDPADIVPQERRQFDALVGTEISRMLRKGDK